MTNIVTNLFVSDAVIKEETLKPSDLPIKTAEKEAMDALIQQAKFAEDYYRKLISQFEENLRKALLKVF